MNRRAILKYAAWLSPVVGIGVLLLVAAKAAPYFEGVASTLGFNQKTVTVTKTVWVTPWWVDILNWAVPVAMFVLILVALPYMPRGMAR